MAHPPTLPAETTYSDVERDLIDNEPPGLFPTDQNSYWGQFRKLIGDYFQANSVDLFTAWYANLDPRTVDANDIAEWEYLMGVPSGGGLTLANRRLRVLSRLYKGAFTRGIRNSIIESYITATFGPAVAFDPTGVAMSGAGVPLYSGATSLAGTYRVYEDIRNFTFEVWIRSDITIDAAGLTRELKRISPYTFTIDNTHADVLDYFRMNRNRQPNAYYRLADAADASGNALAALVPSGGLAFGGYAAPGLIHANTSGANAGTTFDGVDDRAALPNVASLKTPRFSIGAWIRPTTVASDATIVSSRASSLGLGLFRLTSQIFVWSPAAQLIAGPNVAQNITAYVEVTYDGTTVRLYVNGVLSGEAVASIVNTNQWQAGYDVQNAGYFWQGQLDELSYYDYARPLSEISDTYQTGIDVPLF